MRGLIVVLAVLVATPVCAEDFANHFDGRHHDQRRAFWLNNQAWPVTQPDSTDNTPPPPKFTKTYVEGVASRFNSLGAGGHFDLFERKFGGSYGIPAPAVVGTFDHGAAMVEMRWNPGE